MSRTYSEKLAEKDFKQLKHWIVEALSGWEELPKITPDDPPSTSLQLLLPDLQDHSVLARNFERACIELVIEFSRRPVWQDSGYSRQLLLFVAGIKLLPASLPLEKVFTSPPKHLSLVARQRILHAILDIGRQTSASFWSMAGKKRPTEFSIIAITALLKYQHASEAVTLVREITNKRIIPQLMVILQLSFRRSTPGFQAILLTSLAGAMDSLAKPTYESLSKWLASKGVTAQAKPRIDESQALINYFNKVGATLEYRSAKLTRPKLCPA